MRTIIIAGPRRGKSWLALELAGSEPGRDVHRGAAPVRCGDPRSKVKDPILGVEYLPEGIPFAGDDGAAQWVCDTWFAKPGPWVCEGHVMARALRRWLQKRGHEVLQAHRLSRRGVDHKPPPTPADRIIVLDRPGFNNPTPGQDAMHKAVMTVWYEIAEAFRDITEYR